MLRTNARAFAQDDLSAANILGLSADVVGRRLAREANRILADSLRLLDHDDAISPLRHSGPGHDPGALVRPNRLRGRRAGRDGLDHFELIAQVRPAARETIDGRLVERRHIDVRSDILRQHAAESVGQIHSLAPQRPGGIQDNLQSFFQFDHRFSRICGATPKCEM